MSALASRASCPPTTTSPRLHRMVRRRSATRDAAESTRPTGCSATDRRYRSATSSPRRRHRRRHSPPLRDPLRRSSSSSGSRLWAVLVAVKLRPLTRAIAMLVAMISDIAIVHGFFVWPKLIAAAFLLAALFFVILSPEWRARRAATSRVGALVGGAAGAGDARATAPASSGSSRWSCVAAYPRPAELALARGRRRSSALVLMAPWSAYQKYADPPGNRLIKWHLAGVTEIDDRGSRRDDRRQLPRSRLRRRDRQQVEQRRGHHRHRARRTEDVTTRSIDDRSAATSRKPIVWIRVVPLLRPAAAARPAPDRPDRDGDPCAAAGRARPDWRFALTGFAYRRRSAASSGRCCNGARRANRARSSTPAPLAIPLVAIAACVAGVACGVDQARDRRLVAVNALFVLVLYAPAFTPLPGTSYLADRGDPRGDRPASATEQSRSAARAGPNGRARSRGPRRCAARRG